MFNTLIEDRKDNNDKGSKTKINITALSLKIFNIILIFSILAKIDININSGKEWIINRKGRMYNRDSAPNPRTGLYKWDSFYENQVMKGAARFTNEVILDPSKASSIRPHVQQTPVGTILFQFLGYPTAFVWWVWYVRRLFYGTS